MSASVLKLNLNDENRAILARAKVEKKIVGGANQSIKAIVRNQSNLVLISDSDKKISELVTALCKKHNIDYMTATSTEIGEVALPVRYLLDNTPAKIVKTTVAALKISKEEAMRIIQGSQS